MDDLLQKFKSHWQKKFSQLTVNNCHLLLTVSGGVDSIVLVDLIAASGFDFTIAHCNFQLRGEESERDETFVKSLGDKYGKPIFMRKFDTNQYASEHKCSIQEAARELRYAWFTEIVKSWQLMGDEKKEIPFKYIVTAHHADDNIETMLMHFFRGTGIKGMVGIQPLLKQSQLLRPLLTFRKSDIEAYALVHDLAFVEDSSNASDKYTRNFFRNRLIPQIKEVFPKVEDNLLNNIDRFNDVIELYQQSLTFIISKLVEKKGTEWHISILKWKKSSPIHTITYELIKPFGFTALQSDEVIKLLDAENGSYMASPTHRIIRNRNWMIISPNVTSISQHLIIEESDTKIVFENGKLEMKFSKTLPIFSGQNNPSEAFLTADKIHFPLLLRKWKTGDYFYPLGMQKKKKVSRFLIDQKLSITDKEKLWVIESNQKIIWVIGQRIDDRFKISDQTENVYVISYLK